MHTDKEKSVIVNAAIKVFNELCPPNAPEYAACLIWAVALYKVLADRKERPVLQAGTCLWPRVRKDQDDGVSPTHFGYEWHADSQMTRFAIINNMMPEMHVWIALPETSEVIDLSTKYFPTQCKDIINLDWPGDLPPEYMWTTCDSMPKNVIYKASMGAIKIAFRYAQKLLKEAAHSKSR